MKGVGEARRGNLVQCIFVIGVIERGGEVSKGKKIHTSLYYRWMEIKDESC